MHKAKAARNDAVRRRFMMIHSSFTELDSDNKRKEERQRTKASSPYNETSAEDADETNLVCFVRYQSALSVECSL